MRNLMRQAQSENEKKILRWELTWSIFKTDFKRRMTKFNERVLSELKN